MWRSCLHAHLTPRLLARLPLRSAAAAPPLPPSPPLRLHTRSSLAPAPLRRALGVRLHVSVAARAGLLAATTR
jgi:hypothetical protein